jgi:2-hydroxy-6-oxonona-2,4-dienedioate hydrolase
VSGRPGSTAGSIRPVHPRRVAIGLLVGAAGIGATIWTWRRYTAALAEARARVTGRSAVIDTRFGRLEYAEAGDGPALMMVHGTGGGFDQGLRMPAALEGRPLRRVAPSRFGYLRSDFPDDPSSERQADAFVALLDHLGIVRTVIAGGSAGALSAIQFALRHPDRCSGLILLVPAANTRGSDPVEMGPVTTFAVEHLLASDALFWAAMKLAPDMLIRTLLATDPHLLGEVSPAEARRAHRILEEIMPIGPRARGFVNDARLAGRPEPTEFERIRVPTLIVSVEDDRFGTAATARDLARRIPGARCVIYPTGGHVWLGHDNEVATEIERFVRSVAVR